MNKADVAIIGGGPGGYVAAIKAAHLGLKAVLIEKNKLGGVCLNRGCIPTKALVSTAEILNYIKRADEFGIKVGEFSLDFSKVMRRKETITRRLNGGIGQLMKANKIRVISGKGNILEPGKVEVVNKEGKKEIIETKNIILATGSSVMRIPIPGLDNEEVITSDGALTLEKLPGKILIIGGGVIGIEFAGIFNSFGVEVTVVEMLPRILPTVDEEIALRLTSILKRKGIKILNDSKVENIEKINGNLEVTISTSQEKQKLSTEKVLLSAGRIPEWGNIDIDKLGLELDNRAIKVDEKMKTNLPGIYAVGDVVGKIMLAHVASAEGKVAAENIAGIKSVMNYEVVPNCVFSTPEAARVGLTEEEARKKFNNIKVSKFPYMANGKAMDMGETEGMVKVIADGETDEILGIHILGAHASDLIAEATLGLSLEVTAKEIVNTIHAHPTLAEIIAEATEGIVGKPIHLA
jgi:dihydrolipoamide dehydrogenase